MAGHNPACEGPGSFDQPSLPFSNLFTVNAKKIKLSCQSKVDKNCRMFCLVIKLAVKIVEYRLIGIVANRSPLRNKLPTIKNFNMYQSAN